MDKPKKLILGLIPNNTCNLKCEYCYISQFPDFMKKNYEFKYSMEHIANCLSAERLGGPCLINLTGEGETMLQKGIVELCRRLLEDGHYIEFVTNLTVTKVVDEFMMLPPELLAHMEFKISFHYAELKRKGLMDKFFENVDKVQKSTASFTLELMPNDAIEDEIDDIIALCYEKVGAKCQITIGRADFLSSKGLLTEHSYEEYVEKWSAFDSTMFDLKLDLLGVKRKEFCYAGAWTLYVNLYTGEASACYEQPNKQNIFEDPSKPINFCPVGKHCLLPYCINGHAHISMGVIPELDTPTYADIRNRKRENGTEWFSEEAYEFFNTKLSETNEEFTDAEKRLNYISWYVKLLGTAATHPDKVVRRIRHKLTKAANDRKWKEKKN